MHPATVWEHRPCDDGHVRVLARELDVHPIVARLLVLRGFAAADEASAFLNPSLDQLHDPFLLTDLDAGVDRLLAAIARGERIAVHGDYDVDGITSTVIVRRMIEMLHGEVVHFIPERLRDGYGLQPEAIERLHGRGVRVVVTVDCGIRSREAGERARELGVDLVITDPPRTGRHAAARAGRHQSPPPRLRLSRQGPRGGRRGPQAGPRAVREEPTACAGCRASSSWRPSAPSPTSCRCAGRTASLPGWGSSS